MLYYSIQTAPPKWDAGLSSDHSDFPWIVFCCRKEVPAGFSNQFLNSRFHGNCNSWWSCRVTRVAPRIVLDVSYVARINHDVMFHGRPDIWWSSTVAPKAPPIVLDLSCVTRMNHVSRFLWQELYSVKFECSPVPPRNVLDVSCGETIKRISTV